ncbi:MAG: phosphoribosylanthranilate isomerase [Bacteroidetes bacterium]|nr:phosphoribosylanthranilate isomerase [Bacteroidota bacterium]
MIRVKICCISSVWEAQTAIDAGAAALGLVGPMPSGPGIISDELIRDIAQKIPPGVASFLLTSNRTAMEVVAHHRRTETSTIQLVDRLHMGTFAEIRAQLPGIKLVQVVHVNGLESLEEAMQAAEFADALLLDSGNPNLPVKELGGTGRVHNWSISRKIREAVSVPVFLAGGLRPDNVRAAIEAVEPFGLDLCSGVRTDGKLDPWKLEQFFLAINA